MSDPFVATLILLLLLLTIGIGNGISSLFMPTGDINTKTASDASSAEDCIFIQVPGEDGHLIYVKNTQTVYITWRDDTYANKSVNSMVAFAPAYGYGGTYVYFLPDKNILVNEDGVEVPGINRKVGDRPQTHHTLGQTTKPPV